MTRRVWQTSKFDGCHKDLVSFTILSMRFYPSSSTNTGKPSKANNSPNRTGAVVGVDAIDTGPSVHAAGLRAILVVGLAVDAGEAEGTGAGVRGDVLRETV